MHSSPLLFIAFGISYSYGKVYLRQIRGKCVNHFPERLLLKMLQIALRRP